MRPSPASSGAISFSSGTLPAVTAPCVREAFFRERAFGTHPLLGLWLFGFVIIPALFLCALLLPFHPRAMSSLCQGAFKNAPPHPHFSTQEDPPQSVSSARSAFYSGRTIDRQAIAVKRYDWLTFLLITSVHGTSPRAAHCADLFSTCFSPV
jgi:hypothetical protein